MTLSPLKDSDKTPRILYDDCEREPNPHQIRENPDAIHSPNLGSLVQPEPGDFLPRVQDRLQNNDYSESRDELREERIVNLRNDYGARGLQIIVKLANIHLTPGNPSYGGGTWHVEGQRVSLFINLAVQSIIRSLYLIAENGPA